MIQAFEGDRAIGRPILRHFAFVDEILGQGQANPGLPGLDAEHFPETWGVYNGQAISADYAMDPRLRDDPAAMALVGEALQTLPMVSIYLEPEMLFGAARGIYSHPLGRGRDWERKAFVTLSAQRGEPHPGQTRDGDFGVWAGLRIHGNISRFPLKNPKHSLRIKFRGEYGPKRLDVPVFGERPGAEWKGYDTLVLRSLSNDSVITDQEKAQYVRDAWLRESERAMGRPAARGRFVNLFLNGLYWGLYELVERTDEDFASWAYGGASDDYTIINDGPRELGPEDRDAWDRVLRLAEAGLKAPANYQRVAEQIDLDAFNDHWILGQFAARSFWPNANWTVIAELDPEGRVYFPVWDAEAALLDIELDHSTSAADGTPGQLHSRLRRNEDYQARFAERVALHFGPEGALSEAANRRRYRDLIDGLEGAIIADSARWSDWKDSTTPILSMDGDIGPATDHVVDAFFTRRPAVFFEQLRRRELAP